jgi:hypothetical protein
MNTNEELVFWRSVARRLATEQISRWESGTLFIAETLRLLDEAAEANDPEHFLRGIDALENAADCSAPVPSLSSRRVPVLT